MDDQQIEDIVKCPECGGRSLTRDETRGEVTCDDCGLFVKWEGKPKEKKSRKGQADLRNRFCKDYCELCLSMKEDLVLPDTLEIHHVLEVQHGGTDDPENLQTLCTGCHRMVHWRRTYNRHSSFKVNDGKNF